MLQKACLINNEDTSKFYLSSRESKFYFKTEVHNKLQSYFDICFELAELNRKKTARNPTGEYLIKLHNEQDRLLSKEATLSKEIEDILKPELIIARK